MRSLGRSVGGRPPKKIFYHYCTLYSGYSYLKGYFRGVVEFMKSV